MPRILEPNQRFPLVLKRDAELEKPPTFYFRAMSARDYMDAEARCREKPLHAALEFLTAGLVGWDRMIGADGIAIEYDPAKLADLLDVEEVFELFHGFRLSMGDKKK